MVLKHHFIITYDVDIDETRNSLRDRILSNKNSIELSETTFLLYTDFENLENIYKNLKFNKEKDNFVIIDIENCTFVKHGIKCRTSSIENKIENLLKKKFTEVYKTFLQYVEERD